ncbi:MAG: hypothetical protein CM15mV34_1470 [Caudoviricetes sp.]|nr:MAG: hypothetical protein CM15mV34_1470 [Caudoviricetes sp.]
MIPILIATSITCADIDPLIERARTYEGITEQDREEIIDVYYMTLLDKMDLIVIGTQTAKGTGLKIQLL